MEKDTECVRRELPGRWYVDWHGDLRCSKCGKRPYINVKTAFCPHCGSELRVRCAADTRAGDAMFEALCASREPLNKSSAREREEFASDAK